MQNSFSQSSIFQKKPHQNLESISLKQRYTSLPKLANFSTSPSLNSSMLLKLKTRNKKEEIQVDPLTAAAVVKKYLLPMFEKTKIQENNLQRKQQMGLLSTEVFASRDSTAESSVYQELKLSEKLLKEIEILNKKVSVAEQKLGLFEQEKFEIKEEADNLKMILDDMNINYEIFKMHLNQQSRNSHSIEMKYFFVSKQLENYKHLYESGQEVLGKLSEELHDERNINDIRLIFIFSLTI